MKYKSEIILYGLGGSLALLGIYYLSTVVYYIAGLLIPLVYILPIYFSMSAIKKKGALNYAIFFKTGLGVGIVISLVTLVYNILINEFNRKIEDGLIFVALLVIFSTVVSALIALKFKNKA
jgi:hypothetical protein